MKLYLSSYKLGNDLNELKKLFPKNKKTAYISNALDFSNDLDRRKTGEQKEINELTNLGLDVELLDLREYFGKKEHLKQKIDEFGVLWVRGGNVFLLRQAMKLSGFDEILIDLNKNPDILYGGYSAGIIVLSPTLDGMDIVDDSKIKIYENSEIIIEGLNIIEFVPVPHYDSNHPESEKINDVIKYLINKKILFKALRDGEVIIKK
ncbi:MAG: Type 1 glutamine amidotransferase-like domain-containing protein [Candidatus Woesearchaeota archaeon]